ncbi:hypothetical protein NIES267_26390 [Calothrix parasitica NIES-267]|uniref:Uncharacterized protein n=1 Tax=Calothrix parasitica NIES-267 TaxID=1973488 RepID=A0A1Z4LPF9_9CYAN|nr:hypothetical protein NIES267_26390 [Calothrix parasitica NIES-267]
MNNLVIGLFLKFLATCAFCYATILTNSAFAVEGIEKSENNQFNPEPPQKIILPNFDKHDEIEKSVNNQFNPEPPQKIILPNFDKLKVQESSAEIEETKRKFTLNTIASPESIEQEASFSPTKQDIAVDKANSNDSNIDIKKTPAKCSQGKGDFVLAQSTVVAKNCEKPSFKEVEEVQQQLRDLGKIKVKSYYSAPSMSVYIPVGYGADKNTAFIAGDFQSRQRFNNSKDAQAVVGVGLGDAKKSVGVVLSYTLASVSGNFNSDFGIGGFNVKVHRQFKDGWAAAVGMNGVVNTGRYSSTLVNDFENSLYGVVTKIVRTKDDINKPFSRVAVTAGVGNGQFRTENSIYNDKENFNVFGNVAVRVHSQASLIAEWTGQDLALGASIAPFKNIPLVITPAVRDIAGPGQGASDKARFVLGAGFGLKL